jgi:hypothetical protein
MSFYVVTAGVKLNTPIPFENLTLVSKKRPLSPKKQRGYAIVWLPPELSQWHDEAIEKWDSLHGEAVVS